MTDGFISPTKEDVLRIFLLEYYLYFVQSTSLLHRYSEWHGLAKPGRTSARLLVVWPEDSMSQLPGRLEHLQTGAISMVTSVWGTENNHRGINQGSRADDGARTLVFGLKILEQQLPGEPVHCLLYIVYSGPLVIGRRGEI